MRKLFVQFYLLLMGSFLLMALLIGGIYRITTDRAMDKSLDDLMQGALSQVRNDLRHIPPEQWATQLAQTESPLSFDVRIQSLAQTEDQIEDDALPALRQGDIIILEDQDQFMQRIPDSDYVLVAGPISYLSFLREVRWLDVVMLIAMGLSLALPVFLWMRPHWRDLLKLEAATRQLGSGDLDARSSLREDSSLYRLGEAFDLMAGNLQRLIASRQRLTNGIAHELRTPLVRLRYRLELQEGLADTEREEMAQDLNELDALIDEMLMYARLEHPETVLHPQQWQVAPWLARHVAQWQSLLGPLQLRYEQAAEIDQWEGDPLLIGRAMDNLVGNAVRYASNQIMVTLWREGDQACLQVEDDGPGIPDAMRAQVFEPFTRLDPSRDRHTGGCGLGLAIVDSVIRAHQGSVTLDSGRLGGARFTLRWPLVQTVTR